jgi:hypothetical protein
MTSYTSETKLIRWWVCLLVQKVKLICSKFTSRNCRIESICSRFILKIVNLNRSVVGSFTNTRLSVKLAQRFRFDFVCSCVPRIMNLLNAWNSWSRRSVRRNKWAKSTRLLIHQPQDQPAKCFEFVFCVIGRWLVKIEPICSRFIF